MPSWPYAYQPFRNFAMPILRKTAQEKDAGRKLKYFVRGDLGVS